MFLDRQEFAKILTLIMVEKAIDQATLARKCGATEHSVVRWLKGERDLKHSTLGRICKGLDISPDTFSTAFVLKRTTAKTRMQQNMTRDNTEGID
jgi:transcriptional regulator with XRE-family HTH domain